MKFKPPIHWSKKGTIFLASFLSIFALSSVGLAAFVISHNATEQTQGNIAIGEVKDATTHFYNVTLSEHTISFNPKKDDQSGRVRSDGVGDEILTTTLSFDFDHADLLSSITIQLELTDSIRNAIDQGYITLEDQTELETGKVFLVDGPSYTNLDVTHIGSPKREDLAEGKSFVYPIRFGWGSKFNAMNPSQYYDEDPVGKTISDETVASTLNALYHLLPSDGDTATTSMKVNLYANNN